MPPLTGRCGLMVPTQGVSRGILAMNEEARRAGRLLVNRDGLRTINGDYRASL